jgi:hypothetical protein
MGVGSRVTRDSVWGVGQGGGGAGKRAHRRRPVPAAAARCLAKGGSGRDCGRWGLAPGEARGWRSVAWCTRPAWKRKLAAAAWWRRRTARFGGEASVRRGQGRGSLFKATCAPPRDRRTGGGCAWGRARPDVGGTDRWSFACAYSGSVCEAFPASKVSRGV